MYGYRCTSLRQRLSFYQVAQILTYENYILQKSPNEKYLDVRIDSNLSWTGHVNYLCSSISSLLHSLSKIEKVLNVDSRKLIYNGYILPLIIFVLFGVVVLKMS